jgi:SAM-dependent methyltransferase
MSSAAAPPADAVARAASRSPLRVSGELSELADLDELRFREEVEPFEHPATDVVAWIERKELVPKFERALANAGLEPAGTVVDLGAGTCWMSSLLARRDRVERVIAIEFSQRRLAELAPIAMAYLETAPEKVQRVVADFYAHGLGEAIADMVFMDAAFHHAADPVRLAQVAYGLLRPGGRFVLHREPTLSLLRRSRPHGIEGEHGDFEHEYHAREYLRFLERAGFEASKVPAAVGFRTLRQRLHHAPPFSWLNGIVWSEYVYVGVRPRTSPSAAA